MPATQTSHFRILLTFKVNAAESKEKAAPSRLSLG